MGNLKLWVSTRKFTRLLQLTAFFSSVLLLPVLCVAAENYGTNEDYGSESKSGNETASSTRCPANNTGCNSSNAFEKIRERVNKGARDVLKDTNREGRVKEVGETLKYCLDCGMDAARDGMSQIGNQK